MKIKVYSETMLALASICLFFIFALPLLLFLWERA